MELGAVGANDGGVGGAGASTGSSNNGGQILHPAISLRRALYPLVVQRQRHASGMQRFDSQRDPLTAADA
jgi:hypothetical protein